MTSSMSRPGALKGHPARSLMFPGSSIPDVASLDLGDVAGLRALGTVNDLELDCLAFLERAETIALNGRVVHEDVTASVALDEPITLGVVEPLDLACDAHRSSLLAVTGIPAASVYQPRSRPVAGSSVG